MVRVEKRVQIGGLGYRMQVKGPEGEWEERRRWDTGRECRKMGIP